MAMNYKAERGGYCLDKEKKNMKRTFLILLTMMAIITMTAQTKDRPNIKRKGVITATTDLITGVNFEKRYNLVSSVYCNDAWAEVYCNVKGEDDRIDIYVKKDGVWQPTGFTLKAHQTGEYVVATGITCNNRQNCTMKLSATVDFVFIKFFSSKGNFIKGVQVDWVKEVKRTYTPPRYGHLYQRD